MKDNSSEDNKSKSKAKGRKRCVRIENSDSEEIDNNKNDINENDNSSKRKINKNKKEVEEINNDLNNEQNNNNNKQLELQKKLKFIVNEVREKGKYEYNKQEIPESLKYHSDESDSSQASGMKKSIISKKAGKALNNNEIDNKNLIPFKMQISDRINENQAEKLRKSKKSKEGNNLSSINSNKKFNGNNSNKKNINDFNEENNLKRTKEDNEIENIDSKKTEKENENLNIINCNDRNSNNKSEKKNKTIKKYNENKNIKNEDNYELKKTISNDSGRNKNTHYSKYSADIININQNSIKQKESINNTKFNENKTIEKPGEENKSIKNDKYKKEEKKERNYKLKNLLENKKDILLQKSIDKEKNEKQEKNNEIKKKEQKQEQEQEKEKELNNNSNRRKFKNNKYKEEEILLVENSKENDENEEKEEQEQKLPKVEKKNNLRDIIEKLKAKKNEKEDLARQEKEAEEQSLMRGKNIKNKNNEEKTMEEDTEAEREAEKIRLKEKRMEERRLAREKRRKMEEEEKKRKEKEFEERKRKEEEEKKRKEEEEKKRKEEEKRKKEEEKERKEEEEKIKQKIENQRKEEENEIKRSKINEKEHLKERSRSRKNSAKIEYGINNNLPHKVFKDEEEIDEEMSNSNLNNKYPKGKHYKYSTGKKLNNKEEEKRRKQLERDLETEIKKNEFSDENSKKKNNIINKNKESIKKEKKEIVLNDIANTRLERSFDAKNTYKKPVQKNFINGKTRIYKPKRPGGVIRGRSHEKVNQHKLNKIYNEPTINKDNNQTYVLTSMNSKKLNGNKITNSPTITYSKKRSIGRIGGEKKFLQLNKSLGEIRSPGIENGNNLMNGMYNINTLELNSLPDLNSSFDSRLLSYNNNNNFPYSLNNEFYKRTAQKNYNNNTINSGNLSNNSNRLQSMSFFGLNNLGNLSNINGLNYNNGENDNFNMSNINLNSNNSLYELRKPQMNLFDLNSSYNIAYNNPLGNYPNNQVNLSNFLGNPYLGLNNNMQFGIYNYNPGSNFQSIIPKKTSSINIEDLLVLEEKLNEISVGLNKTKIMCNECFEFWNYYYNCSLYGSLEKLFTNILDSNNVQISINYILMSVLICYDCSFDIDVLNNVYSVLKDLLNLNHKNLILIYEHILSKISTENRDNVWVLKLLNIVNSSKNSDYNDYNLTNGYSMTLVEKINFNTGIIIQNIRVLLKNYKTPRVEYLTSLFKKINEKTYEDINNFFRQYILRVDNMNGSILASVFLNNNSEFKSEPAPYIHTVNHKPYSLILDLDETLVHFKVNPENESEGVLKVRPGVMEFLDSVDKYYELIIFTCATQDYANLLIDAIEENKIYFEHRLYRQHTVIIDNDFVKDLTRIGRPLDKIAIVDNMPQNFRLQKENGINIKAFWGEDIYDTALINLSPILITIAEEGGDIRKGLAKHRDEIVEKVTSNISKNNN